MQTVWQLDNLQSVAGRPLTLVGAPQLVPAPTGQAVQFDGCRDGLLLDVNPLTGTTAFAIEALFRPATGGAAEQRFFHVQASGREDRVLLETRLIKDGWWYADTFIRSGSVETFLNDPARLHPLDQWHTLALICDGRQMWQYVNGELELTGTIAYAPHEQGRTSLGMRINRVFWFKGAIASVRITRGPIDPATLLRPPS